MIQVRGNCHYEMKVLADALRVGRGRSVRFTHNTDTFITNATMREIERAMEATNTVIVYTQILDDDDRPHKGPIRNARSNARMWFYQNMATVHCDEIAYLAQLEILADAWTNGGIDGAIRGLVWIAENAPLYRE